MKNDKTKLIIALTAIVLLMAVGYAAFASNLTITGTGTISSNWCVGFDSTKTDTYTVTKGLSTGANPTGGIAFAGNTCGSTAKTTANLSANFKQLGDKVEYTLTIINKGTINAAIKSITVDGNSVSSNQTITKGNIKYIIEMPVSTSIAATTGSTTMKVTAEFQNDTNISSYTTTETQSIAVEINSEQDDGNGGMAITPVNNTYTGTIYRWNTNSFANGFPITEVSEAKGYYDDDDNYYDTLEECRDAGDYGCQEYTIYRYDIGEYTTDASTLNKTYYLKHDVVDDIVTASYVCFVYNNTEHCMKGGVDESSLETKPVFDTNTQIIRDYQTYYSLNEVNNPSYSNPGCSFRDSNFYCRGGGFYYVGASSGGAVYVYGSSSERCDVGSFGYSTCYR